MNLLGMDAHAIHLTINHLPVVLSMMGAAAAVLAFVLRRRPVFLYAIVTLVLAGASSWPALRSGHEAAELLEDRWYVDEPQARVHHDTAERAHLLMVGTALIAVVGWWLTLRAPREARPHMLLSGALLVASVCSATAVGWTSWQGGFIVSRNVRLTGSLAPAATPARPAAAPDSARSHDGMDHSRH